jgi:hypothetical protein
MHQSYKIEAGKFGTVEAKPTSADHVFVENVRHRPLDINGVEIIFTAHLFREHGWGCRPFWWRYGYEGLHVLRNDNIYRGPNDAAAYRKVKEQVLPLVKAWLETAEGKEALRKAGIKDLEFRIERAEEDLAKLKGQVAEKEQEIRCLKGELETAPK